MELRTLILITEITDACHLENDKNCRVSNIEWKTLVTPELRVIETTTLYLLFFPSSRKCNHGW